MSYTQEITLDSGYSEKDFLVGSNPTHSPTYIQSHGGDIAPWTEPVEAQPQLPPKNGGLSSRGFGARPSDTFPSQDGSQLSLSRHSPQSSVDYSARQSADSQPELRKQKSSMFSTFLTKRNKSRSRTESDASRTSTLVAPPLPMPTGPIPAHRSTRSNTMANGGLSFIPKNGQPPPLSPTSSGGFIAVLPPPSSSPKKESKIKGMGKRFNSNRPPPLPPKEPTEPVFKLDTNLDSMDGILDKEVLGTAYPPPSPADAENFNFYSYSPIHSTHSQSHSFGGSAESAGRRLHPLPPSASPTNPIFTTPNPFLPGTRSSSLQGHGTSNSSGLYRQLTIDDSRRLSPKSGKVGFPPGILAPSSAGASSSTLVSTSGRMRIPSNATCDEDENARWHAPESWDVGMPDDVGAGEEAMYSSTDEENLLPVPGPTVRVGTTASGTVKQRKGKRKTMQPLKPPLPPTISSRRKHSLQDGLRFQVRVYRGNGGDSGTAPFHIANIGLSVTVADLLPTLNNKLLKLEAETAREGHKLYLKERGRERVLAQTERPADIVRRRLEQAGYDAEDGIDCLGGEDMKLLFKFVYKTQLLGGPTEEKLTFTNFEYIDLQGQGLRSIPVILHKNAETIVSLNLSRNPILEIPLDFIQSCTTLRELRLTNTAMKRVPQSVRHSASLTRLDLAANRIAELDDAGLEMVPGLFFLTVQNNRLEKLPASFPKMLALKSLNISNNKFRVFPLVVTDMPCLMDLDISFNMISELPDEIGRLMYLENLTIVGNQVQRFPDSVTGLRKLRILDCRRNDIADLSVVCKLPNLERLSADWNRVHALELSLGPKLQVLDVAHNHLTQLSLLPGPLRQAPAALTHLDISHAKLVSLDEFTFSQLTTLTSLKLDHNAFRFIPESLGDLSRLVYLSCADNHLSALPASLGRLQKLKTLDVHNNSLPELPVTIWNCASLTLINATSNMLTVWHDPPLSIISPPPPPPPERSSMLLVTPPQRKASLAVLPHGVAFHRKGSLGRLPPLAHALEHLYLGENRLSEDLLKSFSLLKELKVLNLSFNLIQDLPATFFKNLVKLEELYASGNSLSSIPTEDLHRLTKLSVLFLNGNRLQTLPHELTKVQSLTVFDVGSNDLKYNISNWEFDWNWNFNPNLRYLNLSGNKRLQIKPSIPTQRTHHPEHRARVLSDFSSLAFLRVLGLMDVTTTFMSNLPEENEERRVRTSPADVNGMAYGIADSLGKNDHLTTLDLVKPEFRGRKTEAIFAMFGRAYPAGSNTRVTKYLHDNYLRVFQEEMGTLDSSSSSDVTAALRRSFLKLNRQLHDYLESMSDLHRKASQASVSTVAQHASTGADGAALRCGASGVVVYIAGKTMYIANAGNALAVVSREGVAETVSMKHDPFDRREITRIRAAEGFVSPKGMVNDEIDVSRSFGFFHLLPVVNARPEIYAYNLSEQDEFVIIANRGLWDYLSSQTAVDIAREEKDPMIAAQKLRDFAISYGAEGSTMIMVIRVADLFASRPRLPTIDSLMETEGYTGVKRKKDPISDRNISRLGAEITAPTGHLALVFTDIRNSTHLWEVNPAIQHAIRIHNQLLRRQLRFCGGYEVKTEGDAFMCAFPTSMAALWFCLTAQLQLMDEAWPREILECEDGKEILDSHGKLIARGLSVRMGIHCGIPVCEPDPMTQRMDYFGPMVNRSARIEGSAGGGQIMVSADVMREIEAKIYERGPPTDYSDVQPVQAIEAIKRLGMKIILVGEVKLKGIEVPDSLSLIYPADLEGRQELDANPVPPPPIQISHKNGTKKVSQQQMKELAMLCLRLEALSSGRVFRTADHNSPSSTSPSYMIGSPQFLVPAFGGSVDSDQDLLMILDSLSVRIENAILAYTMKHGPGQGDTSSSSEPLAGDPLASQGFDSRTLGQILTALQALTR